MKRNIITSIGLAGAVVIAAGGIFMAAEPAIGFAVSTTTSQFTISQTITSEISFKTPATNVVLSPSIGGLTGGAASGTTQVVVTTNNTTGYNMTITSSTTAGAMVGNANPANTIPGYLPAAPNVPDFNFTVGVNQAFFGYTVSASTTAELATAFKDNGTACNAGAADTTGLAHCWINASSTAFTLINTSGATSASGSTSTLAFHVGIAANPNPSIPNDTYVATTTLTAVTNP